MSAANRFTVSLVAAVSWTLSSARPVFAWGDGPCSWGGPTETVVSSYSWSTLLWWTVPTLLLFALGFTWRWARGRRDRLAAEPGAVSGRPAPSPCA